MTEAQKAAALSRIAPASVACEQQTGIPAEVSAAQCILETGWLQYVAGNNCYGIKSYPGEYGRELLTTREWFTPQQLQQFLALGDGRTAELVDPAEHDTRGRSLYSVRDWFATFPTLGDCFIKRASLLTEGPYAAATAKFKQDGDLIAYVRAVAPIYATSPSYANSVIALMGEEDVKDAIALARNPLDP